MQSVDGIFEMNGGARTFIRSSLLVFLFAVAVDESVADTYTVRAGDIDYPLTITVPTSFRLAASPDELSRRGRNLAFYNDNPGIRGTYSEVFRSNWSDLGPYPVIFVSTLGTTSTVQGKISTEDWKTLRELFENASRTQIEEFRKQYQPNIQKNYPYKEYEVEDELLWATESRKSSAIVMMMSDFSVDGVQYRELGARTFNYLQGYLIVLDFKIDATLPDALKTVRRWIDQTKLVSIGP